MANIFKKFMNQCAEPKGFLGKIMLCMMNRGHATMTNWGLSLIRFQPNWTMLDIGCGGGATLNRLIKQSPKGKVYGIDISEESVRKAKHLNKNLLDKQVFIKQGSANLLPFQENTFDLVTAVETIYFWQDIKNCFKEVHRVMKPQGTFIIILGTGKTENKLGRVWTDIIDNMTIHTIEEIKSILFSVGFSHVEVHTKKPAFLTIITNF